MGGVLAVAAWELKEKWTVLIAALVAGLVALVVGLFSSLGRHDARDARELAAIVLAVAFAFGIAAVVGSGMINRELVERRHGFFFARPLSAGAIWGGKVLACWLLAVSSGVAVLLPAAAASRGVHLLGSVSPFNDAAAIVGVAAAAVLTLALFSHAFALMVRSHAPGLLALDAVFGIGVIVTVALALRSLVLAFAFDALIRGAVAFAVALLVAFFAAGFAQVSVGRTAIRRGHRALSVTLWGILGLAALLLVGYVHWVEAVNLSDLAHLDEVVCAPRGGWAFVTGRAQGRGNYEPSFLVDTASGRTVRLGAHLWWFGGQFSDDGMRAVWLSLSANAGDLTRDVVTLELANPSSGPVTTPITISDQRATLLGMSPDGRRLAIRDEKTISVVELLTGRLLASVRLPEDLGLTRVLWRVSDKLTLAGWKATPANADEADLRLFELDVSRRTLTETGRVADVRRLGFFWLVFDPTTDRMVTRTGSRSNVSLVLCDARTGELVAVLATCADSFGCSATILSDDTLAVGEAGESGVRLRLFSATGELHRTIEVGPGRAISMGAQPTPRTLVITSRAYPQDYSRGDRKAAVVDVVTDAVTPLKQGYLPLISIWWLAGVTVPTPGSLATRAFLDPNGHFAILDPATNTFRTVLSARWYTD